MTRLRELELLIDEIMKHQSIEYIDALDIARLVIELNGK
jgi:hypothetical protein